MTFFTHYVLTQFNLVKAGLADYALRQRGTVVQTPQWLDQRFDLFERYCLPSVERQTTADFRWLVLFNSETPAPYRARIEAYHQRCPQLTPLFLAPGTDEREYTSRYIRRDCDTPLVVTTWLDNDDMIHRSYLQTIQQHVEPTMTNTFLYYRQGYQYTVGKRMLNRFVDDMNHFLSRVESRDTCRTVWVDNMRHDLAGNYGETKLLPPPSPRIQGPLGRGGTFLQRHQQQRPCPRPSRLEARLCSTHVPLPLAISVLSDSVLDPLPTKQPSPLTARREPQQ